MMRKALALVGGLALALLLFWGLALMVAPPERQIEQQERMTMAMVDDVAMPAEAPHNNPAMSAAAPPPPPPAAPARPAPAPQPAETAQSDIQLAQRDVAEPQVPELAMDDSLPELAVQQPEPRPEPQPEPEPEPEPQPSPSPQPQTTPPPSTQGSQSSRQPGERSGGTPQGAQQSSGGGTVNARPTSRVQPSYPMRARRRGQQGYVEMEFTIRRDGSVAADSIRITDAEPQGVFERSAREAVQQWRFQPRDAPARTRQRVVFQLR